MADMDEEYFKAYSDLKIHHDMINDDVRTSAYRWAILKNYKLFHKKVVLDIGCGTGILSVFCVQAGAQHVYAVDASPIADCAQEVVKVNNMSGKITVIKKKVEELVLTDKVDIIVSEWMGYMLLYECMLPSILFARDNFLKKDGCLFPERAMIYMAPTSDSDIFDEDSEFWLSLSKRYKVQMNCLSLSARIQRLKKIHVKDISPERIIAHEECICDFDLYRIENTSLKIDKSFKFSCFGSDQCYGFAFWFKVLFPGGYSLSTSPYLLQDQTHWQQTIACIEPHRVEQDSIISGSVFIEPYNNRFLNLKMNYSFNNESETIKNFIFDGH